ncbi:hypothetical protein ACVWZ6_006910 [Bradyrhizobium sp. GM6.1]
MPARIACRFSAKAVNCGSVVKRVIAGSALMRPIQAASMPIAFSQTGKNGRCVPDTANTAE